MLFEKQYRWYFLQHFNLLVDIKGQRVVQADCPESVILQASPGPVPAFCSAAFLSAPQRVQKLLEGFPDVLSSDGFTASKPQHGVQHHLLTNPGPPVYAKPWRLDPDKLAAPKEEFSAMEKAGLSDVQPLRGHLLSTWLRRRMEAGGPAEITGG